MDLLPGPAIVGAVAGLLGLGGIVACVVGSGRPRTSMSVFLLAVFATLTVGGLLALRPSDATRPWGLALVAVGGAGACIAAALLTRRDFVLNQRVENAEDTAAAARRELEGLQIGRDDLENQLTSVRKRLNEMLERGALAAESAQDAERIERYRERIRTLRESEEKLRHVIDRTRDGIVMLERETLRLARFTPSVARLTGHGPEALRDMTLFDVLAKGPSEPDRAELQRIAHERCSVSARIVRADGARVPVQLSVFPVGQGDAAQLVAILVDESEAAELRGRVDELLNEIVERERRLEDVARTQAEGSARVEALERALRAAQAGQEQEVEAVAHDLRVPLTSVRSFAEILLRHEDTEASVQREFLEIIRKEAERLTEMIDELLDVRRIRAGVDALSMEDLDLRELLGETLDTLEGMSQEHGVRFEGAWGDEPWRVRGDRSRLHRMIVNLLSNAVKFSSEGGCVETILRDGTEPGSVLLGIRDHGPGIAEEEQEIVFERFHRASTGPDRAPGTGLGLSICREIARAHGARMWPESRDAGGTTLWIEFPAPSEHAVPVETASA